jgi:exoribonuclease-2
MKVSGPNGPRGPHRNQGARRNQRQEGVSDRFETGGPGRVEKQKFQGKSHRNRDKQMRAWQDHANWTSVGLAGQAGIAGAVAAASLQYPDGRWDLKKIAAHKMEEAGLVTDCDQAAKDQTAAILARTRPAPGVYVLPEDAKKPWVRDLRDKLVFSIDNGVLHTEVSPEELKKNPEANVKSRDLDQIQGDAERLPDNYIRILVGLSDIGAFIEKDSPLDNHMDNNATSVYTPDQVFNLLPLQLAEDVFSLNPREDRLTMAVQFEVGPEGQIRNKEVFSAIMNSRAKLDYESVGAWLDGTAPPSPGMLQDPGILDSIKLQDEAAQRIKMARKRRGSLTFESNEIKIKMEKGDAVGFKKTEKSRATEMVENFMVTCGEVSSQFLEDHGLASMQRVVVEPEKWDRIRELAAEHGGQLPNQPSIKPLADFLDQMQAQDPKNYGELSQSMIRLIGKGQYMFIPAGQPSPGHFPMASHGYAQVTAGIRRGGDRFNQRQIKSALEATYHNTKPKPAYSDSEGAAGAENINEKTSIATKVERSVEKSAIGSMLTNRIGDTFDGIVSVGRNGKSWVRISNPPVEGQLHSGSKHRNGDKVRVRLTSVNVPEGHIDFERLR